MQPAISFAGLASGLDTNGIIDGLMGVQRIPILRLQQQNSDLSSRIGILDNLSSALSSLATAAAELETTGDFASFNGTVGDESAAKVTASGDAAPGSYALEVTRLAAAQRTYSTTFADKTAALSASAQTLSVTVGTDTTDIAIAADSSLEDVVAAINGSGAPVSAGILFDGTDYRLQVVGQQTGAAGAVTFADTGLGLQLDVPANTVQAAVDAEFTLDGFTINSPDNLVADVLPGVTLELTGLTSAPTTVAVTPDAEAVSEKIQGFVDSYNAVVDILGAQVGEGLGGATLSGDGTVRLVQSGLSQLISSPIPGLTTPAGDTLQLSDLGITTERDGKLTLDSGKLDEALATDFVGTARYFAGDTLAGVDGISGMLDTLLDGYTDSVDGIVTSRKDGLQSQIDDNDARIASLETLLERFEENLRAQFTALEATMSALQSQGAALAQFLPSQ